MRAARLLHVQPRGEHGPRWSVDEYYGYNDPIHYVFASGDGEDGNIKNFFDSLWRDINAQRFFRLSTCIAPAGYTLESAQS